MKKLAIIFILLLSSCSPNLSKQKTSERYLIKNGIGYKVKNDRTPNWVQLSIIGFIVFFLVGDYKK